VQKAIKKRCPICQEVVEPRGTYVHFQNKHPLEVQRWEEWREKFVDVEVGVPEEQVPPKPPEVEVVDGAIAFIEERLAQVYGVGKNDRIIVRALRDNPAPLRDATTLHAFIKSLAPKAYDSHLATFVIAPLYAQFPNLPQAVDRYLGAASAQPPYPYYGYGPYGGTSPWWPYYGHVPAAGHWPWHGAAWQPPPPWTPWPYHYAPPATPRTPKVYKVVVDGQEIETDEAGYMAWQRYKREQEEHEMRRKEWELRMKSLEESLKRKEEDRVPVKIGDKEYLVPVSYAHLYLRLGDEEGKRKIDELSRKLDEEREARYRAELESLRKDLEELKRRPTFAEELAHYKAVAHELGLQRGGRTTVDLIDALSERLDRTAQRLIDKIPGPGREWAPEIRRTPEERAKVAEEIKRRLERGEEILKAEEELIRAAAKVRPRG
jgi:hypothetical protein